MADHTGIIHTSRKIKKSLYIICKKVKLSKREEVDNVN